MSQQSTGRSLHQKTRRATPTWVDTNKLDVVWRGPLHVESTCMNVATQKFHGTGQAPHHLFGSRKMVIRNWGHAIHITSHNYAYFRECIWCLAPLLGPHQPKDQGSWQNPAPISGTPHGFLPVRIGDGLGRRRVGMPESKANSCTVPEMRETLAGEFTLSLGSCVSCLARAFVELFGSER